VRGGATAGRREPFAFDTPGAGKSQSSRDGGSSALGLLNKHASFVKRVVFPVEILPWTVLARALFHASVSFLRELMKTGTVLFVSHDTGALGNPCRRPIWLHEAATGLAEIPMREEPLAVEHRP